MNKLLENNVLIVILAVVAFLLIIISIIFFTKKSKKKDLKKLDETYLQKLLNSLGGYNNISNIELEHQRLRVVVVNVKNIQADLLKELGIPTFLKGKEIKLLIKNNSKEIYDYLKKGES